METQNLIKLVFVPVIYLVLFTECQYWEIRLDPNIGSIVGTSEARTVLSCSRYCDTPLQSAVAFFFSEKNQQCYCSNGSDTPAEDPSNDPILYGYKLPKDCLEYYSIGYRTDGRYNVGPTPNIRTKAWCDMENGGWTVIQRRLDGSVDFYRNWTEYVRGFGETDREYWIGLDNIHYLTQEPSELYISMETFGDVTPVAGYAWYSHFSIANSALLYRLSIGGFTGDVYDCLTWYHNGKYFSTYDTAHGACAIRFHGAWWYNACHESNLNGMYVHGGNHSSFADGVNWVYPWGFYYSLKTDTMKVRRL